MASSAGSCLSSATATVSRRVTDLPVQGENGAALPLNGGRGVDEACVHVLIELDDQTARAAIDWGGAPPGVSVSLELQAQSCLIQSTARRHRKRVHG
jgi:hypothetical protein